MYKYSKNGYKGHDLYFDTDGYMFIVTGKDKKGNQHTARAYRVSEIRNGVHWEWEFHAHSKELYDTNVAMTLADYVCEQIEKANACAVPVT